MGDSRVQIGVAADNVLDGTAPPELERQLLEARLQSELGRKTSQLVSETEIARDWELLQKASDMPPAARSPQGAENTRGNRP